MTDEKTGPKDDNPVLADLVARRPELIGCAPRILETAEAMIRCYASGGKILVCGNGGSAADSEHITGELMKGFTKKRPLSAELKTALSEAGGAFIGRKLQTPLPAIALTGQISLSTAFANDVEGDLVFAQQVLGFGNAGDVLIGISTSGNAKNVNNALITGRALKLITVGLTGASGGAMKALCDVLIRVPETVTHLVQELHQPVYHALCRITEDYFFAQ